MGGVEVEAADMDGNGQDEIITCQLTRENWCKAYLYDSRRIILSEWEAYPHKTGIRAAAADTNKNGKEEIITSSNLGEYVKIKKFERNKEIEEMNNFVFSGSIYGGNSISVISDSTRDKAKVTYIEDGDTIFLDDGREVRYIGIDTPEIGEDQYYEATNRNKELVYGKMVELEYDQQKIDPYGRILAYVYSNGNFINEELLEEGYAKLKTYPPNTKHIDNFKQKEEEAKNLSLGIWNKSEGSSLSFWSVIGYFLSLLAK
jgi:micrococcal nuclease